MTKSLSVLVLAILLGGGLLFLAEKGDFITTDFLDTSSMTENITLSTSLGDIEIKLLPDEAPKMSENFFTLAQRGSYNDTKFHRVIDGFMIQGGDYENGNGTGGKSYTGELLDDEFSENLSHVRGAISMANRGPNTNGSQFFIVQKDSTFLDGKYSIFGQVVEGMDIVDKIATTKTDLNDAPLETVKINEIGST